MPDFPYCDVLRNRAARHRGPVSVRRNQHRAAINHAPPLRARIECLVIFERFKLRYAQPIVPCPSQDRLRRLHDVANCAAVRRRHEERHAVAKSRVRHQHVITHQLLLLSRTGRRRIRLKNLAIREYLVDLGRVFNGVPAFVVELLRCHPTMSSSSDTASIVTHTHTYNHSQPKAERL